MNLEPGTATVVGPEPRARGDGENSHPIRIGVATILVLAAWIGLIAGFLDLGLKR